MASAVIEWTAHSMEERSHRMSVKGEEVQCVRELKHINTHKSLWDSAMWRKDAFLEAPIHTYFSTRIRLSVRFQLLQCGI